MFYVELLVTNLLAGLRCNRGQVPPAPFITDRGGALGSEVKGGPLLAFFPVGGIYWGPEKPVGASRVPLLRDRLRQSSVLWCRVPPALWRIGGAKEVGAV